VVVDGRRAAIIIMIASMAALSAPWGSAAAESAPVEEGPPRVRLDGAAHDPSQGVEGAHPSLSAPAPRPDEPAILWIGFPGPTRRAWIDSLEGSGVRVLQYLPDFTFLVHGTAEAIDAARPAAPVLWARPFPPALKLPPALRALAASAAAAGAGEKKAIEAIIQLLDVGDARSFAKHLRDAGGIVVSTARVGNRVHIKALLTASLLPAIARWPSVFRVEPFPVPKLHGEREARAAAGDLLAGATCVEPGHRAWLDRKGVSGEGVLVQVVDDGLEQGDASGLPGTAHPDLLGRIAGLDNATTDPEADSRSGHGSFDAGILAGTAASGFVDPAGFLPGQGVAPGARVHGTKIFNNLGRFEIGARTFPDLVAVASGRGCVISSNSWGVSVFGQYDALSAEFDALARDAHPDPGAQPMTFVFSSGNEGDAVENGTGTVGSPATAKNVIAVGASEGCAMEAADGCGSAPGDADSLVDVPRFSSRGPLADGRLGPTLIAPGTQVASLASTAPGYDGTGICDTYWPLGQVLYARGTGTSHAAPLVAGAAALFHEARTARTGEAPSPALVKAALVAAARDVAGGADGFGGFTAGVPNNVQGWGRLSLEDLIPDGGGPAAVLAFDQQTILVDAGDAWETLAFPLEGGGPVKVALAWTDPPAVPGSAPVLVNDLDLEIESGGEVFHGNAFSGGFSAAGGAADAANNVECVFLASPGPILGIRVRAAAISGDGVPGGSSTDQDFALVVLGATDQSRRGAVSLSRRAFSCDSTVDVSLSDLDLKGTGTAVVAVESSAAAEPAVVVLVEGAAGGVFHGSLRLGSAQGMLRAEDGGTITARYADEDDGTGSPSESTAAAAIDCRAPAIADVRIDDLTESTARVSWTTGEESVGAVLHGAQCLVDAEEVRLPRRSRSHSFTLEGLPPGARRFVAISATDAVGNNAVAARDGACFSFHTSSLVCGFEDDLEPAPVPGWTHGSEQGPDDWAVVQFAGAHSPTRAWHATAFEGFKDSFLVVPPLDIGPGDRLAFWHTFQLELGYDGAVIEVSTDGGATWSDLGPSIRRGGYVDVVSGNPLGDRMAWTGQRPAAMSEVEVDLAAWAGPDRAIRFRIASDASSVDGLGWYIDDVRICRAFNKRASIAARKGVYRCGDRLEVTLEDADLIGARTAAARVASTIRPAPLAIALAESATRAGLFTAEVRLEDVAGGIPVSHGDEVRVEYTDEDDGSGEGPSVAAAIARIDCRAPAISGVRLVELWDDQAAIAWETDEPSVGEVTLGLACDALLSRHAVLMGGTSHVVLVEGLSPGTLYRFRVTARDEAGNAAQDTAGAECRSFAPVSLATARHGFDGGADGWTHGAAVGEDAWALEETPLAATPPAAWFLPGSADSSDASLASPRFAIEAGTYLSFWHTYEFEPRFDGGVVEISADGGATWIDLGAEIRRGGYDSVLEPPNPIAGRRAWSGGALGPMTRVLVDLSRWAGRTAQVRFRATSDGSIGGAGWYIDQVEVLIGVREKAALTLDRAAYGCQGRIAARLASAALAGLDGVGVGVTSTSEAAGEEVRLLPLQPGSAIFEGSIEIGGSDAPGVLLVQGGDTVRAVHELPPEEGGPPRSITATAAIDCVAPSISDVAVRAADDSSAIVAWTTDEPATGRVEAGNDCTSPGLLAAQDLPSTAHEALLTGLEPGVRYLFRIRAEDAAGNASTDDAGGACHALRTRVLFCPLDDDVEPGPEPGWLREGRWRAAESSLARSSSMVWQVDGDGRRADASLVLPVLAAEEGTVLEFWHSFEMEEGRAGGVVEASRDGVAWTDLGPGILEGGYRSFIAHGSPLEGRPAWTGGKLGALARVRMRLDLPAGPAGGSLLVRFRFGSPGDGAEGTWIIDDVRASRPVGETAALAFSAAAYRCEAQGSVLLADSGLTGSGRAVVTLDGPRQAAPLQLELIESRPGFFRGAFALSSAPAAGALFALDGDAIEASYRDPADEEGALRDVAASAAIDCVAPEIRSARTGGGGLGRLEVVWETDEPAAGSLLHGADCADLGGAVVVPGLRTLQTAAVFGAEPDAPLAVRIQAFDAAGNSSALPVEPACFEASLQSDCAFEDDFEPADAGWTHAAAVGADDWRVVTFDRSRSPTRSFHASNQGVEKDASLVTPPLEVPAGAFLTFWHTYELEEGFDGAVIEASTDGGASWAGLGTSIREGGYGGTIFTAGRPLASWTAGTLGPMTPVRVALDGLEGSGRRIRFRIICDDSVGSAGWFIDDVGVCTFAAGGPEARFTRGNCNGDATVNLSDAVFVLNHLFLGGPEPPCDRACDTDSNDELNVTDGIYLLNHLFLGGPPLGPPDGCSTLLAPATLGCEATSCAGG
jgi:hypothetical protein